MNIIIVGAGEVGTHIASQLIAEKKNVLIIEKNPEIAARAKAQLDVEVLIGEGTSVEVLKEAGIENVNIFIAATSIDEVNMISCFVASSEFNVPVKIARVRNLDYMKTGMMENTKIGVDLIVNSEIEAALDIFQTVTYGATSGIFTFADTNAQLRDFLVKENSIFNGVLIKDVRLLFDESFIVAGIVRNEELFIPSGNFKILTGDHLYIVANTNSFKKILQRAKIKVNKLKRFVVVGGGLISKHIISLLIDAGKSVRIIEKDYEKCRELSAQFPEAIVINGNVSDQDVFEEENLGYSDALIAATANEELNILAGIYAKSKGVKRAVAIIDKLNYATLATNLGIDSCVSAKLASVDAILKYIRKGKIKNVYTIFEGKAEAIELLITSNSHFFLEKSIMSLTLPKGCLIISVKRGKETIIPTGKFVIKENDSIIIFVSLENLSQLEELIN